MIDTAPDLNPEELEVCFKFTGKYQSNRPSVGRRQGSGREIPSKALCITHGPSIKGLKALGKATFF